MTFFRVRDSRGNCRGRFIGWNICVGLRLFRVRDYAGLEFFRIVSVYYSYAGIVLDIFFSRVFRRV